MPKLPGVWNIMKLMWNGPENTHGMSMKIFDMKQWGDKND